MSVVGIASLDCKLLPRQTLRLQLSGLFESCLHYVTILNYFHLSFCLIQALQIAIDLWYEKGLDIQEKKDKRLVGRMV